MRLSNPAVFSLFAGAFASPAAKLAEHKIHSNDTYEAGITAKLAATIPYSPPHGLLTAPANISLDGHTGDEPDDLDLDTDLPEVGDSLSQVLNKGVSVGKKKEKKEKKGGPVCRGPGILNCITIINATPYPWRKAYTHHYQMSNWDKWPEVIRPGHIAKMNPWFRKQAWHSASDSAAEVVYRLEDTDNKAALEIKLLPGKWHHADIVFMDDLETTNLPKGSKLHFEWRWPPDGVHFVLSGNEQDGFAANHGPEAWMQSMMDEIGDFPLSEIVLGRSHHAGSYVISRKEGIWANEGNTQTQTEDIYTQLRDGGVRVLDVRALAWWTWNKEKGVDEVEWYTNHGSGSVAVTVDWQGAFQAKLDDIFAQINRFNEDFPGELIIVDFHEVALDNWLADRTYRPPANMRSRGRRLLYEKIMDGLEHRIDLPDGGGGDYTELTLRDLVGDGKSGVLVRIAERWVDLDEGFYPGPEEGFIVSNELPVKTAWSDTKHVPVLRREQREALISGRPGPTTEEREPRRGLDTQYIMTLQGLDNVEGSIMVEARNKAAPSLWRNFWRFFTVDHYPSWLTVDGITGTEFKAYIMAMNKCFVARECGDWAEEERELDG